jgi:hypothetical protein
MGDWMTFIVDDKKIEKRIKDLLELILIELQKLNEKEGN